MYGSLDISTSGMIAQRTRLSVISANIANRGTILDEEGNYSPYLRRHVMFSSGDPSSGTRAGRSMGVHVREIQQNPDALVEKYEPGNPFADERGYVKVPDINPVVEQINAMEAARAYEANVAAAEASKQMHAQALRMLA